jgi:hypothetical protein
MADYNFPKTEKPPKMALNHAKLRLKAPALNARSKPATLQWDIYGNNPRVVVNLNDPEFANSERKWGRITAAMDTPAFGIFLDNLDAAIASSEPIKHKIENLRPPKGAEYSPTAPLVLDNTLWVGRDQEGCVFISVIAAEEGWPTIKFIFAGADGRYHKVYRADGTELTKAEMSTAYARSYSWMLRHLVPTLLVHNHVEPPPFVPGNRNGGGQGGGNRGGQQQAAPQGGNDNMDDLAF